MVSDDPESFADLDGHDGIDTAGKDPLHPNGASSEYCRSYNNAAECTEDRQKIDQINATTEQQARSHAADAAIGVAKELVHTLEAAAPGLQALDFVRPDPFAASNDTQAKAVLVTSFAALLIPGGGEKEAAAKVEAKVETKIVSLIGNDARLTKLAEEAGQSVQKSLDHLTSQLAKGNTNPGIGTKSLGEGISYARSRDGARVFFKQAKDQITILGKASKANEAKVIARLKQLF